MILTTLLLPLVWGWGVHWLIGRLWPPADRSGHPPADDSGLVPSRFDFQI